MFLKKLLPKKLRPVTTFVLNEEIEMINKAVRHKQMLEEKLSEEEKKHRFFRLLYNDNTKEMQAVMCDSSGGCYHYHYEEPEAVILCNGPYYDITDEVELFWGEITAENVCKYLTIDFPFRKEIPVETRIEQDSAKHMDREDEREWQETIERLDRVYDGYGREIYNDKFRQFCRAKYINGLRKSYDVSSYIESPSILTAISVQGLDKAVERYRHLNYECPMLDEYEGIGRLIYDAERNALWTVKFMSEMMCCESWVDITSEVEMLHGSVTLRNVKAYMADEFHEIQHTLSPEDRQLLYLEYKRDKTVDYELLGFGDECE